MTPWTAACQAPLSVKFSRQEYWSGLPCPPPGDLPNPRVEIESLTSPALAGRFFTTGATWMGEARCSTNYPLRIIYLFALALLCWGKVCSHFFVENHQKCYPCHGGGHRGGLPIHTAVSTSSGVSNLRFCSSGIGCVVSEMALCFIIV